MKRRNLTLGVLANICNPSTQEAGLGGVFENFEASLGHIKLCLKLGVDGAHL